MDELENKMGAILNDPEAMKKIMSLAQSLSSGNKEVQQDSSQAADSAQPQSVPTGFPSGFDPAILQKLSGLSGRSNIDKNEQLLLKALSPYLSREHIQKLERAMRAAKMARVASSFLGNTNVQSLLGR